MKELDDIKKLWQQDGAAIVANMRIDHLGFRRKLEGRLRKKRNISLFSWLGSLAALIFILWNLAESHYLDVGSVKFYLGAGILGSGLLCGQIFNIRRHILIDGLDITAPVSETQKKIKRIEIFTLKMSVIGIILAGTACPAGIYLLTARHWDPQSVLMGGIIILAAVALGIYNRLKRMPREFDKIKQELEAIEKLENESDR